MKLFTIKKIEDQASYIVQHRTINILIKQRLSLEMEENNKTKKIEISI